MPVRPPARLGSHAGERPAPQTALGTGARETVRDVRCGAGRVATGAHLFSDVLSSLVLACVSSPLLKSKTSSLSSCGVGQRGLAQRGSVQTSAWNSNAKTLGCSSSSP